ncbi:MAG: hypothetical protein EOO04_11345 [Chitinophagaceae bacterium]|nr:MAG: hypothetical protein EOO04_11345 [Chitinophagaceae bacterium]
MIQIKNIRILALCAVLGLCIFSCKKDKDKGSDQVQLFNFGPTGAKHGDTLRFVGSSLSQVTAIQFTGQDAMVEKSGFTQHTDELILVIVPPSAEKGLVILKTPAGDIPSKTSFNVNVKTTASITSMTLAARPGENITLSGNYLNWISRIVFNQDKVVTTFISQSLNELVVQVPEDAQTGPLTITFGGTDSVDIETADTLQVALPLATSIAPNPIKHAQNLTITGTDLDLTKKLIFPGVDAPVTDFVSQTATELVVQVPGAATQGNLIFESASGVQTSSGTELVLSLPAVSNMSPNPIDPGANLSITGTNLDLVSSVTFANAPAVSSFVSKSATSLVVKLPTGVARGKITLSVLNSSVKVLSDAVLEITGSAPPPAISFPIYNDAVTSNWNGWIGGGWGGTSDRANITPVREGEKSIKIAYDGGYGSPLQLGGASIDVKNYTVFKLSVFGAPGSEGKKINIGINGADSPYTITVVEGKWTDYEIPLSTLGLSAIKPLTEIWVKESSGTGGFTVFVDAMGLN